MTNPTLLEEKLLSRLDELVSSADFLLSTQQRTTGISGPATVDPQEYQRWRSSAENLIVSVCGMVSVYRNNFVDSTKSGAYVKNTRAGKGILLAVKDDVEAGLVTSVKTLAAAEMFVDFIDMAEHLLTQDYKDPAASLTGAVLENSLRKIAENNNVTVKDSDDISSLNNKLADKGIYSRIVQKQIHAWKAVRDHADHGKFGEYNVNDVKDMISSVTRFIAEYQK